MKLFFSPSLCKRLVILCENSEEDRKRIKLLKNNSSKLHAIAKVLHIAVEKDAVENIFVGSTWIDKNHLSRELDHER